MSISASSNRIVASWSSGIYARYRPRITARFSSRASTSLSKSQCINNQNHKWYCLLRQRRFSCQDNIQWQWIDLFCDFGALLERLILSARIPQYLLHGMFRYQTSQFVLSVRCFNSRIQPSRHQLGHVALLWFLANVRNRLLNSPKKWLLCWSRKWSWD